MSYLIADILALPKHPILDEPTQYNLADSIAISFVEQRITYTTETYYGQNLGSSTTTGLMADSYENVIYNQIWINPTSIDTGLVVKDEYYPLSIWNSYYKENKTIESVTAYSLFDVYIQDDLNNYQLKPTEEVNTYIIVSGVGVPLINGYFDLKIASKDYYIYVVGKRLLIVPAVHFLQDNYQFTYQYNISKVANLILKEQRRLVIPDVLRSISGSVVIPDTTQTHALNIFDYVGGKVTGVAIPHEKMTPTTNLQGITNIFVNENIANYTELATTKFLLLFREDNFLYECVVIQSIDTVNKKIVLETPAIGDFPKTVTVMFPLLVSQIDSLELEYKTNTYAVVNISASEVFVE